MATKHWGAQSFVEAERSADLHARYGYCRVCFADMAWYSGAGLPYGWRHYGSHKRAASRGLWGTRRPRYIA